MKKNERTKLIIVFWLRVYCVGFCISEVMSRLVDRLGYVFVRKVYNVLEKRLLYSSLFCKVILTFAMT